MVDHAEESFIEWLHPRFDVDQCHQDPRRDMVSQIRWYELSSLFLFCCFFTSCRRWNETSQVCLKDKRNTFLYIWYWTENSKVKKLFLLLLTCVTVCILFTNYSTSVRVCYLKNTRESTHSKKSVIIFVSNLVSWSNLWLDYCTWCYCPSYISGCIADTQLCSISLPIYPL